MSDKAIQYFGGVPTAPQVRLLMAEFKNAAPGDEIQLLGSPISSGRTFGRTASAWSPTPFDARYCGTISLLIESPEAERSESSPTLSDRNSGRAESGWHIVGWAGPSESSCRTPVEKLTGVPRGTQTFTCKPSRRQAR